MRQMKQTESRRLRVFWVMERTLMVFILTFSLSLVIISPSASHTCCTHCPSQNPLNFTQVDPSAWNAIPFPPLCHSDLVRIWKYFVAFGPGQASWMALLWQPMYVIPYHWHPLGPSCTPVSIWLLTLHSGHLKCYLLPAASIPTHLPHWLLWLLLWLSYFESLHHTLW